MIAQNTYRRWLTLCGSANNIRQRGARSARATLEAVILIYLSFCAVTLAPAQDAPWQYHQLADFSVIFENSIFDANRNSAPAINQITEIAPITPIADSQYIELTGVVVGECSAAAFFNASNPDNSGIRLQGEEIAGFSLMDIQTYGVTLQNDNRRLMLPVGSRLNTQDADEWQIEATPYQPIYRQPLRAMQPSAQVNSQAAGQGAQGVPGARVRRMR